jgi:hypothetical protein
MSLIQPVLELANGILCMAVKVVKVTNSISAEERACHRPMELPERP